MSKYISPLMTKLSADNWQDLINPKAMSLEDALDLLGDVKSQLAFMKKLEGYTKEIVRIKMPEGETEYVGHHFSVVLNERVRMGGLDKDRILEEMGQEWVEDHSKEPTEYIEIRLAPVTGDEQ